MADQLDLLICEECEAPIVECICYVDDLFIVTVPDPYGLLSVPHDDSLRRR